MEIRSILTSGDPANNNECVKKELSLFFISTEEQHRSSKEAHEILRFIFYSYCMRLRYTR
ncbi:hypothetical protein LEP1GSC036_4000 [Leptospira weilii str. 2006001853]|uniref:Uncharacterized protein n=1 Tax=Leptospira weilii str. 2006001853 TaxID=1001589 RepID=A0A828Z7M8_9LEPT|nr:hypothetical protein LEP1GSC036_4000 [Leptospira weilii str. 2006001853]